ncbi:glycosyltransferase [Mycobacterium sp. ITM-2016-00317]|uniref:glycosyltransferase n=1 Tax=Mycobacterium sp. ITM-2016-00317 TaxID=2099694 RepID=UPI00287F8A6F|nr:glycosyltransferase [Mycobacterium sp. ITM-2016-00317]WNG90115.1 glycosyltransferase [Mycobacterium sp. ITM-2016-00317]
MPGDGLVTGGYDLFGLAEALAGRGHEVRLFTVTPESSQLSPGGVAVESLPVDAGGSTQRPQDLMPLIGEMARHLIDAFDETPPDVVHCHGWAYGMAAQLAAKRRPVPTVQAFSALGAVNRRFRDDGAADTSIKIESLLARNATAVTVACTDDMQEIIRLGCPRANVSVLPPGVEVDVTAEEIVSRGAETSRRIVAVARDFSPQHGLAQVLRVLPALGADLVLVATDGDDGQHCTELADLARELRVERRVRIVTSAQRDTLTAVFRSADVVVVPSLYEPCCDTVLLAMSCGAPIVATSVGGARDAVIADVTGLLVPPGRLDALGRALRSILGQTVLRQGMGLAGRSRARSRYCWDRIATDAEVVYESVARREHAHMH